MPLFPRGGQPVSVIGVLLLTAGAVAIPCTAPGQDVARSGDTAPELVGLLTDPGHPQHAAALVVCGDGPDRRARLVSVGESACGLEVLGIDAEGVDLRQPGATHPTRLTPGASANRATAAAADRGNGADEPLRAEPVVTRDEGGVRIAISQATLDSYLADIPALLVAATAAPSMQPDRFGHLQMNGFELTAVRPDGLVGRLGLVGGDVVQEVNGAPVRDVGAIMSMIRDLRAARHATVGVRRGDRQLLFVVEVR